MALKKMKLHEKELQQLQNTAFGLEQQIVQLEQMTMAAQHVEVLKTGRDAQKAALSRIKPDEVEDIMDDLQEGNEAFEEVQDALATGFGDPLVRVRGLAAQLVLTSAAIYERIGRRRRTPSRDGPAGRGTYGRPVVCTRTSPGRPSAGSCCGTCHAYTSNR